MSVIRILGSREIKELITVEMALEAVERAYLQKSEGSGSVWPMVFHEFDPGKADLDIKSGNLDLDGIFGLKLVSWYGDNPAKGRPALYGTAMVFDLENGEPKALLNAGAVTDFRTGAAGALGAKYLARQDSETLLMVGCGALCPYLAAATLMAMPGIKRVLLANPRNPEKAAEKLSAIREKVDALMEKCGCERKAELSAAEDVKAAVEKSDVIITATPSYEPMIKPEWVRPGTHISCVGADLSGKQEISSDIMAKARVFGDDEKQCLTVGECEIPFKEGKLKALAGEIGDVISGKLPGRTSPEDITVFDSTGIALQDLASAAALLRRAEELGLGTTVEI